MKINWMVEARPMQVANGNDICFAIALPASRVDELNQASDPSTPLCHHLLQVP